MTTRHNGFTIIEVLLAIVVIGIIGAIGYIGYTNLIAPKTTTDTVSTTTQDPVKIENKTDLDNASTQLDNVQIDDSDNSQLDSAADSF
jgi:prepilin-type N-terminal cleavage/methylation domain-containing protein